MLLLAATVGPQALLAQPVSKVIVAEARLQPLPATTQLVGTVRPNRETVIGSEIAGLVMELPAREGDFLKKGDLVCQLKDDSARLELKAAEQKLAGLQAAVDIALANLERWTLEKQRVTRLSEEDRANAKEMYDTQANFLMAEHRVQEARREVGEQQAVVELHSVQLAKTRLEAPFDGYVTRLRTEVGQWLSMGGAVVDMIDLERVLVRVDVPEAAFPYVQKNQEARVHLDALGQSFTGVIRHIIPQAHEQARTFPIDIEIPNREHRLSSGLFARATIRSGPAVSLVAVPKDAVVQKDGVDRVWMIQQAGPQGSMAIPLNVTLGAEVGEWVAITSDNLQPGMSVVVRGNERLMPFPSAVEVVENAALFTSAAPATESEPQSSPAGGGVHSPHGI